MKFCNRSILTIAILGVDKGRNNNMKKSTEILGLPVISIMEGREIGIVKSLVINPANGASVAALTVDNEKWYEGIKVLPFDAISGLGDYAVTVEDSHQVVPVTSVPNLEIFLDADVNVVGASVLTKNGRVKGKVTEIIINDSGKIDSCEIEDSNGDKIVIPGQQVITYAKGVIIVSEAIIVEQPVSSEFQSKSDLSEMNFPNSVIAEMAPEPNPEMIVDDSPQKFEESDSINKTEEKHHKYLLGKRVSKRIESDNGIIIIEQGDEITEEILYNAKQAGRLIELSMNIQ